MKWDEFKALISGIGPDTALGRIVSIRAEDDEEILKTFTKDQNKIRNAWLRKRALEKKPEETATFIEQMKQMFIQMSGGEQNRENKV